jgi:hypothetical protein
VDLSLTEAERDLADLCRDFAMREIAKRAPIAWEEARCPTDLLREMGELGLLGMLIPEQWGGLGMSTVGFVAAIEQIGRADQSVAAAPYLRDRGEPFLKEASMAKLKSSRVAAWRRRRRSRSTAGWATCSSRRSLASTATQSAGDRRGHQRDPVHGDRARPRLLVLPH